MNHLFGAQEGVRLTLASSEQGPAWPRGDRVPESPNCFWVVGALSLYPILYLP